MTQSLKTEPLMKPTSQLIIFEAANQPVQVRLEGDSLWLSQAQMAEVFAVQKAAISKHLKNIFASGELEMEATVSKMETVQTEGQRSVMRQVEYFNLDAVISVGYRVNSNRATRFRQWATRVLREHLTQGYTLNRQRFEQNASRAGSGTAIGEKGRSGRCTDHRPGTRLGRCDCPLHANLSLVATL